MMYSVEIGKNIVLLRALAEMTQEDLAFDAQISISRLRDIEHGEANPSIDLLESISQAFDIALPVLFLFSLEDHEILDMVHGARQRMNMLREVLV